MSNVATLTLVWLGTTQPDAAASATLERWARDHDAKLEAPRAVPASAEEDPPSLAERCETSLEQARDQLQAGDDEAARSILARLEQDLRQHPELLQAGWFMAERHRIEARIARRVSPDQADRYEQLADVIEGPRAPAFGDAARPRAPTSQVRVALVVHGPRRHEIHWDGAPTADELSTPAGEHHLLVFRGARVAYAGWVSALSSGKIDVWVPDAVPCSPEDFDGVAFESRTRVRVPSGVRCAAWAVAAPSGRPGGVSIAVCSGAQCQAMTSSHETIATGPAPDEKAVSKGFLPAWAAWTLAGVGVAAATSIVLWRAGVFDAAPQPKVIYDGKNL